MSSAPTENTCAQTELVNAYALGALSPNEITALETHIAACAQCRNELEALSQTVEAFASWPVDVLRPSATLWSRLASRIGAETRIAPALSKSHALPAPEWEEVAPGISCKLLATDWARDRVSMLVRLAPGTDYPPHVHAGIEELHLLDGELWVDEVKLHAGDYRCAEAGTADQRVWSETGCTCVLITSPRDRLS